MEKFNVIQSLGGICLNEYLKNSVLVITVCITMVGCSTKEQEAEKTIESVTHMPPNMNKPNKYITIDTSLLTTKIDVVCNMSVKKRIVDTMSYKGKLYAFCGKGCKEEFAKDPILYLNK